MKYVCLVYNEPKHLASLSDDYLEKLVGEVGAWIESLGCHHVMSFGLQAVSTAATLTTKDGKVSVTDGPFAETKEFLGGLTILEARDLNEAIQLASDLPAVRIGKVEVRPLLEPGALLTDPHDVKIAAAIERAQKEEAKV